MVSEEFKKNVESGDAVTIRSALIDYLIIDTTFRRFDEALDYVGKVIDVIEPDDGKDNYDLMQEHWNETYLNNQKVALMVNFSQKRIDHMKQVIKAVLADKAHDVQKSDTVREPPQGKPQGSRKGTGRTVLSEKEIPRLVQGREAGKNVNMKAQKRQSRPDSRANCNTQRDAKAMNEGRTGRTVVSEKSSPVIRTEEEVHPVDLAAWVIGGGIAVAAVGGVAAGAGAIAAKPAVAYTGVALAGAGVGVAVSGGVIKIVKKR